MKGIPLMAVLLYPSLSFADKKIFDGDLAIDAGLFITKSYTTNKITIRYELSNDVTTSFGASTSIFGVYTHIFHQIFLA